MPLFIATYTHPDYEGWKTYLHPHLEWIAAQVKCGTLYASGPTLTGETRSAALLFNSPDQSTLEATITTDPYVEHGQVAELTITQWDPIFGMLNAESTQSGKSTEQVVRETLTAFGSSPQRGD
ncbi:hypothetical protein LRS71_25580 [Rhodococcus pyridinivorans]|uniref:YciI family protein n=1 Tax=Rhodococcus pyridinivorans TaxID=103816 RepID=UPI001E2A9CD8|nr:YciI family protein [Rhodococcus pyridinivorans]MCD5422878.1 hypothetical protein [Rhodococcus pyridinivorans]